MRPAKNIEKLIKNIDIDTNTKMDKAVLDNVLKAFENSKKPAAIEPNIWRIIMKSKITKFAAAAAVIIIAVLLGLHYFGGSIDGASVAWADIAEKVQKIPTVVYKMKTEMTGLSNMPKDKVVTMETVVYNSLEFGVRQDSVAEGRVLSQTYLDMPKRLAIIVQPLAKQYMKMTLTDQQVSKFGQSDTREIIKDFAEFGYTELEHKNINDIDAEGIEVNDVRVFGGTFETLKGQLWVDAKTQLPVLMECDCTADNNSVHTKMTMYDFKWDEELSKSIFEPNIPSDYKLAVQGKMPDMYDEATVFTGLKLFAQMSGGKYPSSMSMMTIVKEGGQYATDKHAEPNQRDMMDIGGAAMFYAMLVKEKKDPAYYGDKVVAKDADAILMRWKISDNEYRVIYGDLTAENVSTEQLAELEATISK